MTTKRLQNKPQQAVEPKESRQSWGEVVQYLDGYAWGIAADGATVCLGRESAVKEAIANPELKSGNPVIDQIIQLERELQKKGELENGRQPELQRPGAFRSRPARTAKRRTANLKHAKIRERATLH